MRPFTVGRASGGCGRRYGKRAVSIVGGRCKPFFADFLSAPFLAGAFSRQRLFLPAHGAAILAVDRHQDADAHHHGHLRGTAEADEGEGDADDGGHSHDHAEIDRDIEEDRRRKTGGGEFRKARFGGLPDIDAPADD